MAVSRARSAGICGVVRQLFEQERCVARSPLSVGPWRTNCAAARGREKLVVALAGPLGNSALWYARDAILLIACAPLAYYMVATLAAVRFFSSERKTTLGSY